MNEPIKCGYCGRNLRGHVLHHKCQCGAEYARATSGTWKLIGVEPESEAHHIAREANRELYGPLAGGF